MTEKTRPIGEPDYKSVSENIRTATSSKSKSIADHLSGPHGLSQRSCGTCRRRKVRCDKRDSGCSNCARANIECVYPGPGRAPRTAKNAKGTSERESELLKRVRRLEGVVEDLTGQIELEHARPNLENLKESIDEKDPDTPGQGMDVVDELHPSLGISTATEQLGKLMIEEGKSRYVGDAFMAKISGEMDNILDMLEDEDSATSDGEEVGDSPNASLSTDLSDHHSFVMGYSSSSFDLKLLHPSSSEIPVYWKTFVSNVDPLCKLLHIPTMAKTMAMVKHNVECLSRSGEALCFAIYFATITSMSDDEVRLNFNVDKFSLLKRFRFGVEQALARANFLTTSELVTLQAFVLFLTCVRRIDMSRFVSTLTGLAIRISITMGLHRDGSKLGLKPYDTEMRRRCWWQIVVLDNKAAEDYGILPSIPDSSFDTEFPLNINDNELDPMSTRPCVPRRGISDMTFCLIRFEVGLAARRLFYFTSSHSARQPGAAMVIVAEKELIVKDLEERLEKKYMVHCRDVSPLYRAAENMIRLIVAKLGFMVYVTVPGVTDELPKHERDRLFEMSIEVMECTLRLQNDDSTEQWHWLFHTYIPWHAIVYALREACIRPSGQMVERGWKAIDLFFESWEDVVTQSKNGVLWAPMRSLMTKARRKREAELQAQWTVGAAVAFSGPDAEFGGFGAGPILSTDYPGPMSRGDNIGLAQASTMPMEPESRARGTPWILDDSARTDLNMDAAECDGLCHGWDELMRNFPLAPPDSEMMPIVAEPVADGWWW